MSEALPMDGRVLVGRYRPVRLIARGGMAEVWEGYDDVLARPVAVKLLLPHLAADEAFAERFRREAVAAARLNHPSIVATFDTGTDGDQAYIVMELVKGHSLRHTLAETGPLPAAVAVAVAADVADALAHAHQAGLVHRDVKPANILLPDDEGETAPLLRVKVADFGIAQPALPTAAGPGSGAGAGEGPDGAAAGTGPALVGSAPYLSPEQVEGRPADARSDVYGLGVVLYEMLAGRPPFDGSGPLATAVRQVRDEPPHLDGVPGALDSVVRRALAKDPAQRHPTAAAFRTALLGVKLDEDDAAPDVRPDPATPPSGIPAVARRPTPRRLTPVLPLAVVAVVAFVVIALLAGDDDGPGTTTGRTADAGAALDIAAVRSFDPLGSDGEENEARAPLAHDGNPATAWASDQYRTRPFGGLKPGVGLVIELGGAHALAELVVRSAVSGWAASVYVADEAEAELGGWGEPVTRRTGITGDATFDLAGREGGAVLLWITDPGEGRRAEVTELSVASSRG